MDFKVFETPATFRGSGPYRYKMARCWHIYACLVVPVLAHAQVPPSVPELTLDTLEVKLAQLASKFPGVTFAFPREETMKGWANMNFKPVQNENDAAAFTDLFLEEFSKYPIELIKLSNLKRVEFVERLAVGKQYRAAVPDYEHEVLYYDVSYVRNQRYSRHVVHHEFYHMLEQEWNGSAFFKDQAWARLNAKDFMYGTGGSEAYGHGDVWSFVHPKPGFINLYSTYGLEEDKAEIWAVLFVPDNWRLVQKAVSEDPILRAKVGYLREFARSKSASMNDSYWRQVSGEVVYPPTPTRKTTH